MMTSAIPVMLCCDILPEPAISVDDIDGVNAIDGADHAHDALEVADASGKRCVGGVVVGVIVMIVWGLVRYASPYFVIVTAANTAIPLLLPEHISSTDLLWMDGILHHFGTGKT